jgi:hypothetical protein
VRPPKDNTMSIEGSYHGRSKLNIGKIRIELELDLPSESQPRYRVVGAKRNGRLWGVSRPSKGGFATI